MIHSKLVIPAAMLILTGITACSDTTAPTQPAPGTTTESARSGSFRVVKNCSSYHGLAGETCTVTSSTLKEIENGSTITYASGADLNGFLNTDVILDLPGPGNNTAFGRCELSLVTGIGLCTFSGGTGKFTWFHATAEVSPLGDMNFAWDGDYRFGPR
jgi:hypothetical protein